MSSMTKGKASGFTLIELLVVLAVLGVLVSMAYPSFHSLIFNNKVLTFSTHYFRALHLARSEAVKRNATVLLCPYSASGNIANASWSQGWTVNIGTCNGSMIHQYINSEAPIELKLSQNTTHISFYNTGGASLNLDATACDTTNTGTRHIVKLSFNGRISQSSSSLKGCP